MTEIKREQFRLVVLPNSFKKVVLEKNSNAFLVIRAYTKISTTVNCEILRNPIIELLRGNVARSGQEYTESNNPAQFPLDLTSKDFENVAKAYHEVNSNLKKNHNLWKDENSDIKEFMERDERKKKALKILEAEGE